MTAWESVHSVVQCDRPGCMNTVHENKGGIQKVTRKAIDHFGWGKVGDKIFCVIDLKPAQAAAKKKEVENAS